MNNITKKITLAQRYITGIYFLVAMSHSTLLYSADIPNLDQWVKVYKSKPLAAKDGEFLRGLLFLSEEESKKAETLKFVDPFEGRLEAGTYLTCPQPQGLEWDIKLNRPQKGTLTPEGLALKVSGANGLISISSNAWTLKYRDSAGTISFLDFKIPPPANKPNEALRKLMEFLGYDGVVLDTKGDFVLVGSFASILKRPGIQALALRATADQVALKSKSKAGAGLLSLVEVQGGFAIFQITLLGRGESTVPSGTKLIIEKVKEDSEG